MSKVSSGQWLLFFFLFKMNTTGLSWSKWLCRTLVTEEQILIVSDMLLGPCRKACGQPLHHKKWRTHLLWVLNVGSRSVRVESDLLLDPWYLNRTKVHSRQP